MVTYVVEKHVSRVRQTPHSKGRVPNIFGTNHRHAHTQNEKEQSSLHDDQTSCVEIVLRLDPPPVLAKIFSDTSADARSVCVAANLLVLDFCCHPHTF